MLFIAVIHRIQSEIIFHLNPNLYTAWLGTVYHPAYLWNLRTPPPPETNLLIESLVGETAT